ncbi:MAG: sigma-54 dependent transcriptional regulator [Sphaerochaetaceae bacterium]|nr:sigma-54 dependent transcriptional regulator [Sphaerochaetaceae bacterium]MDD3162595.1 sigma-54 dependent transcriptional regulator [Sphaerochaetaceae bacterium]MDD4006514.1 sigma-54 dependent transcriptional regulator [Sphaerochaetaceae bacterium]MDD4395949.1 sigma-54 dependent transcriptional regulator [Sphaerochaetaceae bacterium]
MRVLIVDDEDNIRNVLARYLKVEGMECDGAENGLSAQRMLCDSPYDICVIDLKMPGIDGIELLKWMRLNGLSMPAIMISAHGEISDAVEALKEGAQDYLVKPFNPEELILRISTLVKARDLARMVQSTELKNVPADMLTGISPEIMQIRDVISKVSQSNANVLITGESGTGKEVVARSIHGHSLVSGGPFVAINIGGVPENLLESELFGHEKGAFTGAIARKVGMFELASGGTLFLDEIGDMPRPLQVKILRVLQDRKITRLGGTVQIPINARIICATNKNLEEMVRNGDFREDLFYRLNVVRIIIPPLRARPMDIEPLSAQILSRLNKEMGRHIDGFTVEAMNMLKNHSFYGNVRELENILERAVIFADSNLINEDCLDLRGSVSRPGTEQAPDAMMVPSKLPPQKSLKEIEKESIINALHRWEGNRTKAASELGITRRTLISKIAEYNLDI